MLRGCNFFTFDELNRFKISKCTGFEISNLIVFNRPVFERVLIIVLNAHNVSEFLFVSHNVLVYRDVPHLDRQQLERIDY